MKAVTTTIDPSATLEYAPKPPVHRRRSFRRAVWIVALLGVGFVAWRWVPAYAPRAWYLYWQRQCMNFRAPADHVAYEEDESRAAALFTRTGYQSIPLRTRGSTQPLMEPVAFVPPPVARLRGGKQGTTLMGNQGRCSSAD